MWRTRTRRPNVRPLRGLVGPEREGRWPWTHGSSGGCGQPPCKQAPDQGPFDAPAKGGKGKVPRGRASLDPMPRRLTGSVAHRPRLCRNAMVLEREVPDHYTVASLCRAFFSFSLFLPPFSSSPPLFPHLARAFPSILHGFAPRCHPSERPSWCSWPHPRHLRVLRPPSTSSATLSASRALNVPASASQHHHSLAPSTPARQRSVPASRLLRAARSACVSALLNGR